MRNSFEREMEETGKCDLGRKLTGRLQYSAFFLNEPNLRLKCGPLGGNYVPHGMCDLSATVGNQPGYRHCTGQNTEF